MRIKGIVGFQLPAFPGSQFIVPVLGSIIFFYGGLPFLSMHARNWLSVSQV